MKRACLTGIALAALLTAAVGAGAGAAATSCRTVHYLKHTTKLVWRWEHRTVHGHHVLVWARVRVTRSIPATRRVCTVTTTTTTTTTTTATASTTTTTTPYRHIVIAIEENYDDPHVFNSGQAPYLQDLGFQGEVLTNYHAVSHPSEPNYLALFSGSTQGTDNSDSCIQTTATSLAGEAAAAGVSIGGYVEGLTSGTNYDCRHDPFSQFADATAAERDFSAFPSDFSTLPRISFVIPNSIDDMHDQGIQPGDLWARNHLDAYEQWSKTHDSLLVVISDENASDPNYLTNRPGENGNTALAIIVGAGITPGTVNADNFDHYSLLRTVEDMFGLPHLGASASATDLIPPQITTTVVTP